MSAQPLLLPAKPRKLPLPLLLLLLISFSIDTAMAQLPYLEGLDGIPVLIEKSHKWGMLSPEDGSLLFDGYFDAEDELSEAYYGIFTVKSGEKVYIYKLGKTPVKLTETAFSSVGVNSEEGIIPVVSEDQVIQFFDVSAGKILSPPDEEYYGNKIIRIDDRFCFGAAVFRNDKGRYGLIDSRGEVATQAIYTHMVNSPYGVVAGLNEEKGVWEITTTEIYDIHYNRDSNDVPLFGDGFILYDFTIYSEDGSTVLCYIDPEKNFCGTGWNDNLLIGHDLYGFFDYTVWDKHGKLVLPYTLPGMPFFDFDTGMYYYLNNFDETVVGCETATGETRFKVQGTDFILLKNGLILVENTNYWTLYGRKDGKPIVFEKVSWRLCARTVKEKMFGPKYGTIQTKDYKNNSIAIGLGISEEEHSPLKDALLCLLQDPDGDAPLSGAMNEDPGDAFERLKGLTGIEYGNKSKNYFRLHGIDARLEKEKISASGYHFSGGIAFTESLQTASGTPNYRGRVYFCSLSVEPLPDQSPEKLLRTREELLDFFVGTLGFRKDEEYLESLRQIPSYSTLGTAFKEPVYLRSNLRYSYDVILPGEEELSSGDADSVTFEMISHHYLESN